MAAASTPPRLDDDYAISPESLREYTDKGHTCLRGLASRDEVAAFRPAIEKAARAHSLERRPLAERETYGQAFLQTINLWVTDATVQGFVFSRRFAKVAAELMGVAGSRLYHDQALFKEPSGGPTPWHQDQFYWPLETDRTITMWMPLVDVSEDVGSMHFAAGSHERGHLGDYSIGDESQRVFDRWVAEHDVAVETHGAMSAGDATFHSGWTLHSAGPNHSDEMRAVMTVIYFADGARVSALDHPARRLDHEFYLPECAPGELAASSLTPRLYPPESERYPAPPERVRDYRAWLKSAFETARGAPSTHEVG